MFVPKFEDLVFYPFSHIENIPLICSGDNYTYLCVFVNFFPSAYPSSIEIAPMRDLVEFAQTKKVEQIVIFYRKGNQRTFTIDDYIKAANPN